MKAAVLKAWGSPLVVETVPDPTPGTGEVVVDVVATGVLGYASEVLSGARQYLLRLPVVPGLIAIGRLRALGPDATRLAVGVGCSAIRPCVRATTRSRRTSCCRAGPPAASARLSQDCWGQGAWAEQLKTPMENVFPIGPIASAEAARWCVLGALLVPYGGLLAAEFQPGETLLVNGATGGFGGRGGRGRPCHGRWRGRRDGAKRPEARGSRPALRPARTGGAVFRR